MVGIELGWNHVIVREEEVSDKEGEIGEEGGIEGGINGRVHEIVDESPWEGEKRIEPSFYDGGAETDWVSVEGEERHREPINFIGPGE